MLNNLKSGDHDEQTGINMIRRACQEPVRQISGNGGYESSIVGEKFRADKSANFGFNVATGVYEDLVKAGVIEPATVTGIALQYNSSISAIADGRGDDLRHPREEAGCCGHGPFARGIFALKPC